MFTKSIISRARRSYLLSVPGIALGLVLVALLFAWSSGPKPAFADHIPEPPEEEAREATFSTSGQGKWGPDSATPSTKTFTFFDFLLDESLTVGDIFSILGEDFGLEITAGITAGAFAELELRGFDSGTLAVNYPMEASFFVPKNDTGIIYLTHGSKCAILSV